MKDDLATVGIAITAIVMLLALILILDMQPHPSALCPDGTLLALRFQSTRSGWTCQ